MPTRFALADGPLGLHRVREADPSAPVLTLDPMFTSSLEGLTGTENKERADFAVGNVRIAAESVVHENVDLPEHLALDVPTRAWEASLRISRDLRFARLDVWGGVGEIQQRFINFRPDGSSLRAEGGRARYYDVGVSLTRTHKFTRWMTGWISLSISKRQWLGGEPPLGETSGVVGMLTIGSTFR